MPGRAGKLVCASICRPAASLFGLLVGSFVPFSLRSDRFFSHTVLTVSLGSRVPCAFVSAVCPLCCNNFSRRVVRGAGCCSPGLALSRLMSHSSLVGRSPYSSVRYARGTMLDYGGQRDSGCCWPDLVPPLTSPYGVKTVCSTKALC